MRTGSAVQRSAPSALIFTAHTLHLLSTFICFVSGAQPQRLSAGTVPAHVVRFGCLYVEYAVGAFFQSSPMENLSVLQTKTSREDKAIVRRACLERVGARPGSKVDQRATSFGSTQMVSSGFLRRFTSFLTLDKHWR